MGVPNTQKEKADGGLLRTMCKKEFYTVMDAEKNGMVDMSSEREVQKLERKASRCAVFSVLLEWAPRDNLAEHNAKLTEEAKPGTESHERKISNEKRHFLRKTTKNPPPPPFILKYCWESDTEDTQANYEHQAR